MGFLKPRSTRLRMMPTATVSNPRTPLKTTVIPSRDPSAVTKLPLRWTQLTRLRWKARLKRLSAGSIATQLPKRKNTKKSRRNSKVSPCPSSKRWEVPLEACLAVCQEVCLIWEVCPVLLEALAAEDPAGGPTIEEID